MYIYLHVDVFRNSYVLVIVHVCTYAHIHGYKHADMDTCIHVY